MLSFGASFRTWSWSGTVSDQGMVSFGLTPLSVSGETAIAPRNWQTRVPRLTPAVPKLSQSDPKHPAAGPKLEPRNRGRPA